MRSLIDSKKNWTLVRGSRDEHDATTWADGVE